MKLEIVHHYQVIAKQKKYIKAFKALMCAQCPKLVKADVHTNAI